MKKIIVGTLLALSAVTSQAFDKANWNFGYQITTVRMNANNWIGFQVVPKSGSGATWVQEDVNTWFGVAPTNPRYATISAILLTAKTTGKAINFCPCNVGGVANTGGVVWDIGSGLDIQ